MIIIIINISRR